MIDKFLLISSVLILNSLIINTYGQKLKNFELGRPTSENNISISMGGLQGVITLSKKNNNQIYGITFKADFTQENSISEVRKKIDMCISAIKKNYRLNAKIQRPFSNPGYNFLYTNYNGIEYFISALYNQKYISEHRFLFMMTDKNLEKEHCKEEAARAKIKRKKALNDF